MDHFRKLLHWCKAMCLNLIDYKMNETWLRTSFSYQTTNLAPVKTPQFEFSARNCFILFQTLSLFGYFNLTHPTHHEISLLNAINWNLPLQNFHFIVDNFPLKPFFTASSRVVVNNEISTAPKFHLFKFIHPWMQNRTKFGWIFG